MSLLDTASLIVTPNGVKEGKLYSVIPSDGSGDLSVTRATTATRVNSAGLVELVPYNLLTWSEDFTNADWLLGANVGTATITANNTIAPNGTLTADKLDFPAVGSPGQLSILYRAFTASVSAYNGSFYIKGQTGSEVVWISVTNDGVNYQRQECNLTTEWQRFDLSLSLSLGTQYIQVGVDTRDTLQTARPAQTIYLWGAQLVEGSTAKDYQKTETRLNIPRLDYSNGTCPSLLVEPQRTNRIIYSSSFDTSPWIAVGTTITPNTQVAPDGTTTGDTYNTSQSILLLQTISASPSTTYTLSLWVKLGTATNICLVANNTAAWNTIGGQSFDSSDGLNTSTWTRIEWTFTTPASLPAGAINIHLGGNSETGLTQSTGSVYLWGAQLEAGSYATSYIPTTSASVTRNADVISKTGISSLIGQTEGTMFFDVDFDNISQLAGVDTLMTLNDGTTANEISILIDTPSGGPKTLLGLIRYSNSIQALIYAPYVTTATRYKIAMAYNSNDVVFYINGIQVGTDTSASIPSTSNLSLNSRSDNSFLNLQQEYINAVALWKTRLTNTQLAQLTSI
jgi:Carbohydrate binding domain